MSATPTRSDRQEPAQSALPLEQGVRVLASIGKQEGLRALLAFSDLRENTRQRRPAPGAVSAGNLLQNERLVLHEVLQLLCRRAQALTQADSIMIALAEGAEFVCRASAGNRPIPQGIRLNRESKFLGEALESGRILRCDDSETDARVQLDFALALEARSTILVPLRGRSDHLGVLQAFWATPWAFSDHDIRCLDLFGELVLAALKPVDQDRRLHWLGNVAGELLQKKPAAIEPSPAATAITEQRVAGPTVVRSSAVGPVTVEPVAIDPVSVEPDGVNPDAVAEAIDQILTTPAAPAHVQPANVELAQIEVAKSEIPEFKPARIEASRTEPAPAEVAETGLAASALAKGQPFFEQPAGFFNQREPLADQDAKAAISAAGHAPAPRTLPDLGKLTEPIVIPVEFFEQPEPESEKTGLESFLTSEAEHLSDELPLGEPEELDPTPSIPHHVFSPLTSRPGLSVVLALVVVAALFSAGVWWGMQAHTSYAPSRIAAAPKSVTTPPAPDDLTLSVGNDSIAPTPASGDEPPTPVTEGKLAELPKITNVRHWSSSMGSTVVIDMEDQVNYEVHRLMSPERIYFDLHDTALPADLDGKTMDVGDASLSSVRIAQPVAGMTRIVLDTRNGSNFSVSMETNPYRLVVELRDSARSLSAKRLAPTAPGAKPAPTAPLVAAANPLTQPLPARTGKFRIVLDAGHGGWDLGTVGRQGLLEKDLVLDVTRRIGKLLQSRNGAEVMFTRTGDDYVALDQRADFANKAQADLFVSVHANYSNSITARGVETYYTNLFSTPGLKEIEKHADGTFAQPAPVTLSADGLHDKIEESRRLAASVQRSLYATLAAKNPDIRDRGIKDASFVVLTGTTMPAILTEVSFVSSPADEHNLQSDAYRQQIAEAIYKGIARYEESFPKAKVAQLRPAATGR
jgi:N-acetylmuramoyl-L-alanine amidase